MLSQEFIRDANHFISSQAEDLLSHQMRIASYSHRPVSGRLAYSLSQTPNIGDMSVSLTYPLHIRFLDMKKSKQGKKKKNYVPIYNKYVYGYLQSGVRNWLNARLPEIMVKSITTNFK